MTFPRDVATTADLIPQSVTGVNSDGNDVVGDGVTVTVPAVFAPAGSTELVGSRDTVIDQDTVYLAPVAIDGSAVFPTAMDVLVFAGDRFEVDGSPQRWVSPFTGEPAGWAVRVRKVSG